MREKPFKFGRFKFNKAELYQADIKDNDDCVISAYSDGTIIIQPIHKKDLYKGLIYTRHKNIINRYLTVGKTTFTEIGIHDGDNIVITNTLRGIEVYKA